MAKYLEGRELEQRLRLEAAVLAEPSLGLEIEGVIAPQRFHAAHGVRYVAHHGPLLHGCAVWKHVVVRGLLGILSSANSHPIPASRCCKGGPQGTTDVFRVAKQLQNLNLA
jgi:hypothetical protein